MSNEAAYAPQSEEVAHGGDIHRITVLEALADANRAVGPSRSSQSTPPAGDADDQ